MQINREDLLNMNRKKRINIVNSLSGLKPAVLIGTISENNIPNLAIFSSVFHIGSNPPLIGFIQRSVDEVPRHTYNNILKTGYYTINHVHESFVEKAHQTSAKYKEDISEFDKVTLNAEYMSGFKAPFVKESQLKIALKLVETISIKSNNTILIVGEVQHVIVPGNAMTNEGYIDFSLLEGVVVSGLNSYYGVEKITDFSYISSD